MNDNDSLEIDTSEIEAMCSQYDEVVNMFEEDSNSVSTDYQAFIDNGILSTFLPDLKDKIEQISLSAKAMNSYIRNFSEEQERIDDNKYDGGGGSGGGDKDKGHSKEPMKDEDIISLFGDTPFLKSLFSAVVRYPNILNDESMHQLLKELLSKDPNLNPKIIEIINFCDSQILQTTLREMVTREININDSLEYISKIKSAMLVNMAASNKKEQIEVEI